MVRVIFQGGWGFRGLWGFQAEEGERSGGHEKRTPDSGKMLPESVILGGGQVCRPDILPTWPTR